MKRIRKKSMTRRMLINIGLRIAVVIVITTTIAYYHMVNSIETSTLIKLDQYIAERGQRESSIFDQCAIVLKTMKKQTIEKMEESKLIDPKPRFEHLFAKTPDGVTRSRIGVYDGQKDASIFIDADINIDDNIRRRALVIYDIASNFGSLFHPLGINLLIVTPDNTLTNFWPPRPDLVLNADKDADFTIGIFSQLASKEKNPERMMKWTPLNYAPTGKKWLVYIVTPVDIEGQHTITLCNYIMLDVIFKRMITDHLEGTYNVIMHSGGQLVAHPKYMDAIQKHKAPLMVQDSDDTQLNNIYQAILGNPVEGYSHVYDNPDNDEYIAITKIEGPDWYFMAVLPKEVIRAQAMPVASFILVLGFISLIIEVCILYLILKNQVAKPLEDFEIVVDNMASGNYGIRIDLDRDDELGRMAHSFNRMAIAVGDRDTKLESYASELENRVKDRTTELEKTHEKLVESSRKAGMSQVAANMLHKVGNFINSAFISVSQIEKNAMTKNLDTMDQIANKLEANKEKCGQYLEDEDSGEKLISVLH